MSLKPKLEAVIYAAEEPVTLAQLAMIFADDALAWKAEQEAARAAQTAETAEPVNEAFDYVDTSGPAMEPAFEPAAEAEPAADSEAEQAEVAEPGDGTEEALPETGTGQAELDPVAEARRTAKQRDKEVRAILRTLLDEIIASCASDSRGVEIREIAGGFRMATKPEFHDAVRAFIKSQKPPLKLSLPALETLAVVAYKQPVTAPEVNEIRGVDSSGVFGSLLARKLIATAGRKQVIGRPILYKTTKEFLLRFGMKDLSELPSMEEFEKIAAIELEDAEPAPEQAAHQEPAAPVLDENAPEDENGEAGGNPAAPSQEVTQESNLSEAASPGAE